jgi:hypothetical protein
MDGEQGSRLKGWPAQIGQSVSLAEKDFGALGANRPVYDTFGGRELLVDGHRGLGVVRISPRYGLLYSNLQSRFLNTENVCGKVGKVHVDKAVGP